MLSLTVGQSGAILSKFDPSTVNVRNAGVTAFDLALSAWAHDSDDQGDEAPLDTLLAGIPGYFDEFRPGAPEQDIWELADALGEVTQEFVREDFGERPLPKSDPKQE